jgi:hypothetical protein
MRSMKRWALAPTSTGATETGARGRRGRLAAAAITALLAATLVPGAAAPASADVSVNGVGPIAANGFPSFFSDGTTKLQLCELPNAACLSSLATLGEAFYFSATAATPAQPKLYAVALEATSSPALGNLAFTRIRITMGGLVDGATYTITHPYGVSTFIAGVGQGKTGGVANGIKSTLDLGCLVSPCTVGAFATAGTNFAGSYAAGVRPTFLTQSNAIPGQTLGDITTPGTVTGAPTGVNAVTVTGPNAGGPGVNTLTVDQFLVQGLIDPAPITPQVTPNAPIILVAKAGNASVLAHWTVPGNGGSAILRYHVRVVDAATGTKVFALKDVAGSAATSLSLPVPNGITVRTQIQAINAIGASGQSNPSNAVTPATVPSKPTIRIATAGIASVTGNWTATFNGGSAIIRYHVRVVDAATGTKVFVLRDVAGSARTVTVPLARGIAVRVQVQAINAVGASGQSNPSNAVTAR